MSADTTDAVSHNGLVIPLVNLDDFLRGNEDDQHEAAQRILRGFQTAGFIYIRNHGISPEVLRATFEKSAEFFQRPQSQKDGLAWTSPESNRGYVRQGREKTTDLTDPEQILAQRALEGADLKETMEIGREGVAGAPNRWPDQLDDGGKIFKYHMLDFFERCKALHLNVMRAIAMALGLDTHWFDEYCDAGDNTLRLLHYPSVPSQVFRDNKQQVRAGAHTDYGSLTLLFQDMAGGLQVLSPEGSYVDATPIPDTVVVNAGDLLARWSNDTIKSTKHRVVEPATNADKHPARYSIAYFCNPNFDRVIDAIPGTYVKGADKKYERVKSGEYLVQRLRATY